MDFDATLSFKGLQFGLAQGKSGLLIVKTGSGGTIYGHDNKYLSLASQICDRYDFSVMVSDNPLGIPSADNMEITMAVVKKYISTINEDIPVYYFGVSKGGQYGAMYGYKFPFVKKWLLLNIPLIINWHRSQAGLNQMLPEQEVTVAFGEKDPSYRYSELVDLLGKENIRRVTIPTADHNFSHSKEDFTNLPIKILFQ